MEKVKVDKELFESLQRVESNGGHYLTLLVMGVIKGETYIAKENLIFNTIDKEKMLRIYKYGYELEETPEAKILRAYNGFCQNDLDRGALIGIKFTLNTLGIKIKGINE